MMTYGVGVDVWFHGFLISVLGGEWSHSRPSPLPSGKEFLVATGHDAPGAFWNVWRKEELILVTGNRTLIPQSSSPMSSQCTEGINDHLHHL
jgi:hypothetical protein